MGFKVGDRVRIIDAMNHKYIGKIGVIEEISSSKPYSCKLIIDGKKGSWGEAWLFSMLELVEDLNAGVSHSSKYMKLVKLHEEQAKLYELKNKKYGDSFGISVKKYGLISALTRMSDKWNRIENLILSHDKGTDDESLRDSLCDLANYCNMTVIEMEVDNDI